MGVSVRAFIENQSETKHVESLKNRRLDEGSNPSDSTLLKTSIFQWIEVLLFSNTSNYCQYAALKKIHIFAAETINMYKSNLHHHHLHTCTQAMWK